ncbi:PREDICTED: protein EFR3 homolog B-like [Amphimedon queenslandica]|uniref:Uncharacterized protein n=1 Tax=Amphimedon queenslandica TaxID=400682 RepID=A0A1X7UCS1_AMPQE|nr:PREDICTED: protein EFR3 homolog B-like [Amphimedon queenslandica]|eukprot:XP_003388363.1 PREDICTED: protein EFR3 homolog B-like [Amphimedon queenslandica]
MSTGCCGVCCHKPRYKRLVDGLYPEDVQNEDPLTQDLDKLLYLAKSDPQSLDDVGEYLTQKLRRALSRDRRGHVCVSLKIMDKLLLEVRLEHLRLLAESYLNMIHELLTSNRHFFQNLAANSFVAYAERAEESPPYHRQYDFCIERFAAMSLLKREEDETIYKDSRLCGLRALRAVVQKIGPEGNNLWDSDHLNKIIPAYLINMEAHTPTRSLEEEAESDANCGILAETGEAGLKEIVTVASLTHANAILHPVLCHFDLNSVWINKSQFATDTFVLIIQTMQPQVRYLAIQCLLAHLDSKTSTEYQLKNGILNVLSSCVGVATDGSIGPSVLDVFRTLVKHLRKSIEESTSVQDQEKIFYETTVRIVGEFASVLPDYHNPDILNLIFSYMPLEGDGNIRALRACNEKEVKLISLLVQCLCVVADSSHPTVLESTLPESLLVSLSQLFGIERADIQLNVMHLWHKMIDHNENKTKVPFDTKWTSIGEHGLVLGNAPLRFRHSARKVVFPKLLELAHGLFASTEEHVKAFYTLLLLFTLELTPTGIKEILILIVELEDLATSSQTELAIKHINAIHACIAGCLHIVSIISEDENLKSYIGKVIELRRKSYKHLLPEVALGEEGAESSEAGFQLADDDDDDDEDKKKDDSPPYFNLIEKGFVSHPNELARNSSTLRGGDYSAFAGDHSRSFRSYSLDHSQEQESGTVITFEDLKEESLDPSSETPPSTTNKTDLIPSFEEMIGQVQTSSVKEEVANILQSASPGLTVSIEPGSYDADLGFL